MALNIVDGRNQIPFWSLFAGCNPLLSVVELQELNFAAAPVKSERFAKF
jgi:hypothetical protein